MSNSTIKLKSSTTAGNTPSSLETGEFAINVVDGNLFYGSASAVKQDLALGNITASGGVSASTYYGDGSNLTGIETDPFPYTGSAIISGSLEVIGDIKSNEDVIIQIDADNNTPLSKFVIKNGSGASIYTIDEEGTTIATTGASNNIKIGNLDGSLGTFNGISLNNDLTYPGIVGFAGGSSTNDNFFLFGEVIDMRAGGASDASMRIAETSGETTVVINHAFPVPTSHTLYVDGNGKFNDDLDITGDVSASGTITANAFVGDGSGITGLTSAAISSYNNAGANRVITSENSSTVNAEAFLNFSNQEGLVINNAASGLVDTGLKVHGNIFGSGSHIRLRNADGGGGSGFYLSSSGDLAGTTFKLSFGDLDNQGNNTTFIIDDANEQITTSKALSVTGNITVTGTVDGRDVATDGTKLDGIEASADVTDTANVTAAGALMDSEVTSLSLIKGLTAAQISGAFDSVSASLASDIPTNNNQLTNGAGYTTNTGTVTSVGGTGTVSGLSLSGTVTTSGNLTLGGTISISSTNITDVDAFSQTGTYASLRAQGTTAGDVGLGNVTNESKATMFTSPTFTGTTAAPTPSTADDSTKIATTAYVQANLDNLIGNAGAALDTLGELSASLADATGSIESLVTEIDGKLAKSSNLSDLTNAATARTNLGVDAAGTDNSTDVTLAGSYDYITISGQQITRNQIDASTDISNLTTANVSEVTNLYYTDARVKTKLNAESVVSGSAQINHDSTTGFVANEHIDHSTVSITAGSGLTGGGTIAATRTINVGAGDGISVAADSVAVDATVLRTTGDGVISSSAQIDHDATTNFNANEHFTQANITTVGTIGTGVWQGTAIADGYISSATTWNNKLDSAGTIATNDYAKYDASGDLIGRSYSEVKTDLSLNNVENTALSTYTGNGGALDNQYITNGAGYTTNTGTVTSVGGTGTVDGLTLSGTVTTSGNLTLGGAISITTSSITDFPTEVSRSAAAAGFGAGGGGGSGTVTEVTVGTGLDVTNGTTTPNVTLDLTEVIASDSANRILTTDGDGTLTAESGITANTSTIQFNDGDAAQGSFGIFTDLVDDIEGTNIFVGDIAAIGSTLSATQGYLYNLSGSWAAAQANSTSTSTGLLGVATSTATMNRFLLKGYFSIDDANISGTYMEGAPIYINASNAGKYSFSPPSTGNISRIIGHLVERYSPDRGANYYYKIYFNPSSEWIEL